MQYLPNLFGTRTSFKLLKYVTVYTFEKRWYRGEKGVRVVELEDCGQNVHPLLRLYKSLSFLNFSPHVCEPREVKLPPLSLSRCLCWALGVGLLLVVTPKQMSQVQPPSADVRDACCAWAPLPNPVGHREETRRGPYLKRACVLVKGRKQ